MDRTDSDPIAHAWTMLSQSTTYVKSGKHSDSTCFFCFIEYQKAFDYVNHNLLYHKVLNKVIEGDLNLSICNTQVVNAL